MDHDAGVGQRVPAGGSRQRARLGPKQQQSGSKECRGSREEGDPKRASTFSSLLAPGKSAPPPPSNAHRLPWWPEASRKAPMEAASPTHTVLTSGRMCRIVSNTAMPAQRSAHSVQLSIQVGRAGYTLGQIPRPAYRATGRDSSRPHQQA